MKPLNCIIADDEPIARRGIRKLASSRPELNIIAEAASTNEVESILSDHEDVDLIFLDIDFSGSNGMDLARRLNASPPMIIFTTAFAEYAVDSYEVAAIDYLLKPLTAQRFNAAVDKALAQRATSSNQLMADHILIKADRKFEKIAYQDIIYIEGLKDYVSVYLSERRLITRATIKSLIESLPEELFLRINKSYIINLNHVESFSADTVTLYRRSPLPIGPTYKKTVAETLQHRFNA